MADGAFVNGEVFGLRAPSAPALGVSIGHIAGGSKREGALREANAASGGLGAVGNPTAQRETQRKRQAAEDGLDMALHVRDYLCLVYLGLPLPLLLTLHSVATDFDSLCHCLRS